MSNMPSHCLSKFASGSSRESYLRALRGSCAKLQVERAASFATRLGSVDHVDRTDAWDCEVHSPGPPPSASPGDLGKLVNEMWDISNEKQFAKARAHAYSLKRAAIMRAAESDWLQEESEPPNISEPGFIESGTSTRHVSPGRFDWKTKLFQRNWRLLNGAHDKLTSRPPRRYKPTSVELRPDMPLFEEIDSYIKR